MTRFATGSLTLSAGTNEGTELTYRFRNGATFVYNAQAAGGAITAGRDVFRRHLRRRWIGADSWTGVAAFFLA